RSPVKSCMFLTVGVPLGRSFNISLNTPLLLFLGRWQAWSASGYSNPHVTGTNVGRRWALGGHGILLQVSSIFLLRTLIPLSLWRIGYESLGSVREQPQSPRQ